ncbi:site-2 protease family protein, partial [bacterium]|nr:site-2 protease family protein [bacterium]
MTSLEPLFSGLISFGYFLVVLGLAVIIHEWGHFIVAKLCGAKVERFAVGFGKSLFTYQWGETEYAICALPLGGYVKITGMDPEDELTGAEWEYLQLSPWKRMAIVVAGPMMNFVLAFGLYVFIMGWFGEAYTATTTVGHVPKGSWGWELGLRDGDKILAVNN